MFPLKERELVYPMLANALLPNGISYAPAGTRFEIVVNGEVIETVPVGGLERRSIAKRKQTLFERKDLKQKKAEIYFIYPSKAGA